MGVLIIMISVLLGLTEWYIMVYDSLYKIKSMLFRHRALGACGSNHSFPRASPS